FKLRNLLVKLTAQLVEVQDVVRPNEHVASFGTFISRKAKLGTRFSQRRRGFDVLLLFIPHTVTSSTRETRRKGSRFLNLFSHVSLIFLKITTESSSSSSLT